MINLTNWFWRQLPREIKEKDTYLNNAGEGLLQRYLRVFSQEVDEEMMAKIEGMTDQLDPLTADSKFLNHLAYAMGNPPDLFNDEELYRKFLKFATKYYQYRSTYKGYELIFNLFGYSQVAIYEPFIQGIRYDEAFNYDEGGTNYDSICPPCKPYYIAVMPPESGCLPLPEGAIFEWDLTQFILPETLSKMICHINPINMQFQQLIPLLSVCETFRSSWVGSLIFQEYQYPRYDSEPVLEYDNEEVYDAPNVSPLATFSVTDIHPNAYTLMAKNLGGESQPLDFLVFKYQNEIVKTLFVEATEVDEETVRFDATIPFGQFNGPYDTFQLVSSLGGIFLERAITIADQEEEIRITFTLNINECAI